MKKEANMDAYIPPYDITDEMLELTSEIMEQLGRLGSGMSATSKGCRGCAG